MDLSLSSDQPLQVLPIDVTLLDLQSYIQWLQGAKGNRGPRYSTDDNGLLHLVVS